MAPHDPLFKSLLRAFFAGFLRLVAPELAARLDLSAVAFLDKEFVSTTPPRTHGLVDLLARAPLRPGSDRFLLVHVEVEARARRGMGNRLRDYHRAIQSRHEDPILSIVVYLKGGQPGVREQVLDGDLTAPGLTSFRYLSFGLSGCPAAEYLASPEPLAWALAALMNPGSRGRAGLKQACLNRLMEAPLSDMERIELVNFVETYLQLTSGEAEEFFLRGIPETRRARVMLYRMSWLDQMKRDGAVEMLEIQIENRFGSIPDEMKLRLGRIRSADRLRRLARQVLTAQSLQDLGLG
jgi:hypothetical protein